MPGRLSKLAAQRLRFSRKGTCLLAGALAYIAAALPADAQPSDAQPLGLKECEQTDSAPLVVRACTAVLNAGGLDVAERHRILLLRATGWMKEEEFAAAADDYSAVLETEAQNVQALEGRAAALGKLGEHARSAEDWTRLIALAPQNDMYLRQRGLERMGAKEFDAALADFDAALAIAPREVEAYMGRAQVFDAMKDIARSKQEFEKGIAVRDDYLPLYWMRGEMARAWGDKDLAIASYTRVLQINSLHEDARRRIFYLGVLHPP